MFEYFHFSPVIQCKCALYTVTKLAMFFSQTNDFVRDLFRDKDGFISLPFEIVAGGCVSRVLNDNKKF